MFGARQLGCNIRVIGREDLGFQVVANTPEEFAARIKVEMAKWGKVIEDAKIKPEAPK